MTPIATPRDLTLVIRGRRQDLGLSQAALARRAGVSRQWVNEFERGKPTAELQLVLRLLDALDLRLSVDGRPDAQPPGGAGRTGRRIDLDALLDAHRQP